MTTTDTTTAAGEAEATWGAKLAEGDPIARARLAATLAQAATERAEYFARQRARAIKAAVDAGTSQAAIATELGITRGAINKILVRLEAQEQARP